MNNTKEKITYGSTTNPKLKITIGKWYLEIGRVIESYYSLTELARGIEKQLKPNDQH